MGLKSIVFKPLAIKVARDINRWSANALQIQDKIFQYLIKIGTDTKFGRDHSFDEISSIEDFQERVPLRSYRDLQPYLTLIRDGESNVLWKGLPKYFAITRGSQGTAKAIPVSRNALPYHLNGARNTALNYYAVSGNGSFFDGKLLFLTHPPGIVRTSNIAKGSISNIIWTEIPSWHQASHLPSDRTNQINSWDEKIDVILDEIAGQDIRMISGSPDVILKLYEKLLKFTGKKKISQVFPNYSLCMHSGMGYDALQNQLESYVGRKIPTLETYPAAEGFLAFADSKGPGLILNANAGIFFEFVEKNELQSRAATRLTLRDVEIDTEYAVVTSTNSGLWAYVLGDLIRFISLDPFRVEITGRISEGSLISSQGAMVDI